MLAHVQGRSAGGGFVESPKSSGATKSHNAYIYAIDIYMYVYIYTHYTYIYIFICIHTYTFKMYMCRLIGQHHFEVYHMMLYLSR